MERDRLSRLKWARYVRDGHGASSYSLHPIERTPAHNLKGRIYFTRTS
jgi:hypothetical protein